MYVKICGVVFDENVLYENERRLTGLATPTLASFNFVFSTPSLNGYAYYGVCDDNETGSSLTGVLKVISEVEFNADKQAEHQARKPYPSWVGDINTMSWQPPVPYPQDDKMYQWDESVINWVEVV